MEVSSVSTAAPHIHDHTTEASPSLKELVRIQRLVSDRTISLGVLSSVIRAKHEAKRAIIRAIRP